MTSPTPVPARAADAASTAFTNATHAVVGKSGARRLAALAGGDAVQFADAKLSDIATRFGHVIDPRWLFMQRVCGRVVRTDATTGEQRPVPFATVEVQDTDCSFLGYFPVGWRWSWLFPFRCTRETIATTTTDACGNFCVWVPRFDIDWVLRWRLERLCFPVILQRPNLADLIEDLRGRVPPKDLGGPGPRPGPGPDPVPDLDKLRRQAQGSDSALHEALRRIAGLPGRAFGESGDRLAAALSAPARLPIAPPLDGAFLRGAQGSDPHEVARHTVAAHLRTQPSALDGFRTDHYVGPMRRCIDVIVPEWVPMIDVPDITFRVLQDVNGDGVEEQIYGESYFDVRWDAGTLPFVTLEADATARTAPTCQPGSGIPCGNQPAIVTAGRLPLTGDPSTFDAAAGYGLRTNRPHPNGTSVDPLPNPEAQSPVYGKLSLFGCNRTDPSATHYRLTYRYKAPGGSAFGPSAPFVGVSWWLYRLNGSGIGEWFAPSADSNGWYAIALPAGPNAWLPEDLLLDWPTGGAYPDGTYELQLELGTPMGGASSTSGAVHVVVDNAVPAWTFDIAWRKVGALAWLPVGGDCPVVLRGATPVDVEFKVTLTTTSRHFRSTFLEPLVCGGVGMTRTGGSGGFDNGGLYEYWHEDVTVQGATLEAVYRLPASAAQGTYGFAGRTVSRAFSPDVVAAPPTPAFEYDTTGVWQDFSRMFSVFDA